jgi:hypothetical protein
MHEHLMSTVHVNVTNNHYIELETSLEGFLFNLLGDRVETDVGIQACLLDEEQTPG